MKHFSLHRHAALAALLFLGSIAAGSASVTLLPQEQAIANYMVSDSGQGRPYMVLDPVIEQVARARAQDMAVRNYFDHVNPDGVAANYLLRQAGYQLPAWWGTDPTANYVESIAAGSSSASVTWTAWMNSPPHKTHLLGENSFFASETHYGVGYYYDPNSTYQYYWVVITAPPQPIEITTPDPAAKVITPDIAVAGYTDPGTNPASIQFRIENPTGTSDYQPATGVANWSGTATGLAPGPNVIRAQSLDSNGNVIAETTCKLTYVVMGTLTVTVSGSGSVTAALAGATQQAVGEPLAIRAVPASGYIFEGWTGSIVSGSASLKFTMQNGLDLQANFEPNPFLAITGAYYGAVTTGTGAGSGLLRVTVSKSGLFTGRLLLEGKSWSFTGTLDANGDATISILGKNAVTIALQADLTGGSGDITGTVSYGGNTFALNAGESTFSSRTNPAPQTGRYTLVLAADPNATGTSIPQGDGYAAIVVSANGDATVAGRLADGTPFSTTGHVANDGTLALYFAPSGAPAGSNVTGLLTFRSTNDSDIDGTFAWTKTSRSSDAFYPAGFATQLPSVGSVYVRPGTGLQAMDVTPGAATAGLGDGNITQPLDVPVTVSQQSKAVMVTPGLPDLKLSINPISGAVSGTFVLPGGNVTRGLRGIVLQKQQSAFGYFRGLDQCGYFSLAQ